MTIDLTSSSNHIVQNSELLFSVPRMKVLTQFLSGKKLKNNFKKKLKNNFKKGITVYTHV